MKIPIQSIRSALRALFASFALLVLIAPSLTCAASFDEDFAVVFVDAQTEARFGPIPLNRSVLAQGIQRISDAGAKGLVLKFFIDLPKAEQDDKRLTDALSHLPSVLQARLDDTEAHPNALPDKFTLAGQFNVAIAGSSGWIPLPRLAAIARDIGFVDFGSTTVPMVEHYQSRSVKSLVLSAMELAAGSKAILQPGRQITVGTHIVKLDDKNQAVAPLTKVPSLRVIPFNAVLDGSVPASAFRNKVVILAYDGPHIDSFASPAGTMGAHRLFVSILKAIYDSGR